MCRPLGSPSLPLSLSAVLHLDPVGWNWTLIGRAMSERLCVSVCVCVLTLSIKDTVKHCRLLLLPSTGHGVHTIFKHSFDKLILLRAETQKLCVDGDARGKGHRDAEEVQYQTV